MRSPLPLRWRVHAAASAVVIPPLISMVSLARLANWLGRVPARPPPAFDEARMAAWVSRILRPLPEPWRHTCLRRSAVLYHLLRRSGRPVELWVGVRKDDGALTAHAWLMYEGAPYLEPETSHADSFKVIARFPADT